MGREFSDANTNEIPTFGAEDSSRTKGKEMNKNQPKFIIFHLYCTHFDRNRNFRQWKRFIIEI
jgi:hypothetical protein